MVIGSIYFMLRCNFSGREFYKKSEEMGRKTTIPKTKLVALTCAFAEKRVIGRMNLSIKGNVRPNESVVNQGKFHAPYAWFCICGIYLLNNW